MGLMILVPHANAQGVCSAQRQRNATPPCLTPHTSQTYRLPWSEWMGWRLYAGSQELKGSGEEGVCCQTAQCPPLGLPDSLSPLPGCAPIATTLPALHGSRLRSLGSGSSAHWSTSSRQEPPQTAMRLSRVFPWCVRAWCLEGYDLQHKSAPFPCRRTRAHLRTMAAYERDHR